jgi:hypothetical protein
VVCIRKYTSGRYDLLRRKSNKQYSVLRLAKHYSFLGVE